MSVQMKALRPFPYAGVRLAREQEFSARGESDARVLEAVKLATRYVQTPKAITDPIPDPAPVATKRGKGYRKQSLEAEAATGSALDSSPQGAIASGAQAPESGTAEKPDAGTVETAPPADEPATGRRRYSRRDFTGTPE